MRLNAEQTLHAMSLALCQVGGIRESNGTMSVLRIHDPKARSNRYAFMTRRIKAILENRNTQGAAGFIFLDRNGNHIDRISNAFRRAANELFNKGVDDERQRVCFHTLRHTFASWLEHFKGEML